MLSSVEVCKANIKCGFYSSSSLECKMEAGSTEKMPNWQEKELHLCGAEILCQEALGKGAAH